MMIIMILVMSMIVSTWQSHCKSYPGWLTGSSCDECRLSTRWPPTLRPSHPTWEGRESATICTHSEHHYYSTYRGWKMSWSRHCSMDCSLCHLPKADCDLHSIACGEIWTWDLSLTTVSHVTTAAAEILNGNGWIWSYSMLSFFSTAKWKLSHLSMLQQNMFFYYFWLLFNQPFLESVEFGSAPQNRTSGCNWSRFSEAWCTFCNWSSSVKAMESLPHLGPGL